MKTAVFALFGLFVAASGASAVSLASPEYVRNMIEKRVDTSEGAVQKLEGTYTVEGKMEVPTPALPDAE